MKIQIKKLNNNAKTPIYGSEYAAGMDLFSSNEEPIIIEPQTRKIIPTGLSISYDDQNYYMRIAPRSGLSVKYSIDIGAGVIDYDYRGEIKIVLINNHKTDVFQVNKHMKIAQMVPTMSLSPRNIVFEEVNKLEDTERGQGGFGSSGN